MTKQLAERLGEVNKADIQVSTTGLTMPGGNETEEKPVGTMFNRLVIKGRPIPVREVFKGDRPSNH